MTKPINPMTCRLAECQTGECAKVRGIHCAQADAERLRTLGLYEGASIGVVDCQNGLLLDVCGARLAVDGGVARAIIVERAAW